MSIDPELEGAPRWALEYEGRSFAPWALTVDVVALAVDRGSAELHAMMVVRGTEPFAGSEAWPGGFVQPEDADGAAAALREAGEETSQHGLELFELGTYDRAGRDPREFAGRRDPTTGAWEPRGVRVASRAFLAPLRKEGRTLRPAHGFDARSAHWAGVYGFLPWEDQRTSAARVAAQRVRRELAGWAASAGAAEARARQARIDRLFGEAAWNEEDVRPRWELLAEARLVAEAWRDRWGRPLPDRPPLLFGEPLAFDHRVMLADALSELRRRIKRDPAVMRLLAPEIFKLSELQSVFEAVAGRPLYRSNFRRVLTTPRGPLVEPVGRKEAPSGPGKPADLFRIADAPPGLTQLTLPWSAADLTD